jgi:hypothetical protein
VIPPSRHAIGVVLPFATATSICRSKLTISTVSKKINGEAPRGWVLALCIT